MEYLFFLFIAWLILPGLYFVVAIIFESRVPPIGKRQARAFLPGEPAIAVILLAFLEDNNWQWSKLLPGLDWSLVVFIICLIIAFWRQRDDWAYYIVKCKSTSKRSVMSPSKWAHDILGYYLTIPFTVVNGLRLFSHWNRWAWLFLAALVFYAAFLAWDIANPASDEDAYARQPDDWEPIWKSKKITWTHSGLEHRIWERQHVPEELRRKR